MILQSAFPPCHPRTLISTHMNPVIIIPARMASTRLPGKPLAGIGGEAMIVRVWRNAQKAGIGPAYVAAGDRAIAAAVEKAGGQAVMTDPDLASGSDRVWAALQQIDRDEKFDAVINLQGDEPLLDPALVKTVFGLLRNPETDIGTLACEIREAEERTAPRIVKAVLEIAPGRTRGRALYFTRNLAPSGEGPHYGHIGIYAWRRAALQAFVQAPKSALETREKLEQLRALVLGLRIDAALVSARPLGVDTPEDLERVRKIVGARS